MTTILWVPHQYAVVFGVDLFRNEYRAYFGPTSLFLFAMMFARGISWAGKGLKNAKYGSKIDNAYELAAEEKGYLVCFVIDGKATIYVDITDGIAGAATALLLPTIFSADT